LTITSSLRLLEMLSMTLAADLPKALSYMDTHMPAEEPMSVEWVLWTLTRARVLWEMGNLVQCLALLQQCQIRLQSARQRSTVSSTSGAKTSSSGNATDSASDEAVLYLPHVLNNLAIVYGAMGKTNLSLMHLQMAGSVANAMRPSLRLDILADRTPDILYNMGLAMLGQLRASPISELSSSLLAPSPKVAASTSSSSSGGVGASRLPASGASLASGFGGSATGSPLPHANTALHAAFAHRLQQIDNAFRCFRTAALHLSHLPSLFLRMAELCFLRHQISQILSAQPLYDVVCIHACPTPGAAGRSSASGSGYDKGFLALQLHTQQHSLFASAGTDGHESGMSLQQARLYLQTALGLRPRAVVLRFHILLALTYCCLMLGDYYAALRYASLCLELPDGTVDGRVCVSLYAAECLCRLDRAKEAMRFLVPRVLEPLLQGTMALSTAPQSQTVQSLQSAKMEAFLRARAALYVNLASCLMLQGMFDKARAANAKALEMAPGLPAAIVNEAYIALALGEHDRALRLFQAFRL
jgi:tetratricopeptide (TPR) repeat protein